jgi:hypothetical protein
VIVVLKLIGHDFLCYSDREGTRGKDTGAEKRREEKSREGED